MPACPKCDYARHAPGRPRHLGAGLWQCADCGGRWRELGQGPGRVADGGANPVEAGPAEPDMPAAGMPDPADEVDPLALLRGKMRRQAPPEGAAKGMFRTLLGPISGAAGGVAAVLFGWFAMSLLVSPPAPPSGEPAREQAIVAERDAFELSSIKADRLVRDGRQSVRVEGRITNLSDQRQAVEPVYIVMTGKKGEAMGRWRHLPALSHLEPGQTIRFTSLQGKVPPGALAVEVRFATVTKKTGFQD